MTFLSETSRQTERSIFEPGWQAHLDAQSSHGKPRFDDVTTQWTCQWTCESSAAQLLSFFWKLHASASSFSSLVQIASWAFFWAYFFQMRVRGVWAWMCGMDAWNTWSHLKYPFYNLKSKVHRAPQVRPFKELSCLNVQLLQNQAHSPITRLPCQQVYKLPAHRKLTWNLQSPHQLPKVQQPQPSLGNLW